jgi:hypothetical protein
MKVTVDRKRWLRAEGGRRALTALARNGIDFAGLKYKYFNHKVRGTWLHLI